MRDVRPPLDLTRPRTVTGVFATTFELYFSYPALFVVPAALVLVPYQAIILSIRRSALVSAHGTITGAFLVLVLIDVVVIVPLVATFAMQALVAIAERERPGLGDVFRHALPVFPGVAAAQVVASVLIVVGMFALIIPGVFIAVRLAVITQTAAFERTKWPTSMGRAWAMSGGRFFHVLGALIVSAIVLLAMAVIPSAIASAIGPAAHDVVAVIVEVFIQSFGVLMLAVLYFDLRAREGSRPPAL